MKKIISALLIFFCAATAQAIEKLEVQGLFANKAVLKVDGKRHVLAVGLTSPEGVKVVSVNARGAVLEVDGKQKQYDLGSSVSTSFEKRKSSTEKIFVNAGGMYMTFGNINEQIVIPEIQLLPGQLPGLIHPFSGYSQNQLGPFGQ